MEPAGAPVTVVGTPVTDIDQQGNADGEEVDQHAVQVEIAPPIPVVIGRPPTPPATDLLCCSGNMIVVFHALSFAVGALMNVVEADGALNIIGVLLLLVSCCGVCFSYFAICSSHDAPTGCECVPGCSFPCVAWTISVLGVGTIVEAVVVLVWPDSADSVDVIPTAVAQLIYGVLLLGVGFFWLRLFRRRYGKLC
eukprot:TRINITY_DN58165_c0_g1_i1.p1 TRINITY_DN58165_c0_g1~~TRINITY_DN58165_c0_g1_i1.p1  ORF type:complete len:195 (+),score=22.45 TRINITY_DN58165_c0_g1_i1:79-663(+)